MEASKKDFYSTSTSMEFISNNVQDTTNASNIPTQNKEEEGSFQDAKRDLQASAQENEGAALEEAIQLASRLYRPREDQFIELLLSIDDQKPTSATFHLLYEWVCFYSFIKKLIDGHSLTLIQLISYSTFSDPLEVQTQLDFFYLFFTILKKCPLSQQVEELRKLNRLVTNAHFVKIYSRSPYLSTGVGNWIQRLMEEVLPGYLEDLKREEDEDQQPIWSKSLALS